jgi:hypothetical protein
MFLRKPAHGQKTGGGAGITLLPPRLTGQQGLRPIPLIEKTKGGTDLTPQPPRLTGQQGLRPVNLRGIEPLIS